MKTIVAILFVICSVLSLSAQDKYVMVIHGGAGTILKKNMSDELEAQYKEALKNALSAGYVVIQSEGSSLDAVEAAVKVLEDNPLFNAGKGAVFTNEGKNELDASIMDGKTQNAGAVAGVTTIRNPIEGARAVMEKSEHVMMVGAGAEKFAEQKGITTVDPSYFYTESRWRGLENARKQDSIRAVLDHDSQSMLAVPVHNDSKFGTVGAVALDKQGNLAAATSTGGMTNKRYGRVGDAPIIGAGTYASNTSVAVSCTGWGEFFIRSIAAYDVAALMEYKGLSVEEATKTVVGKIGHLGGDGGMIAIDKDGHIAMPFNTAGMYRAAIREDGSMEVYIYK